MGKGNYKHNSPGKKDREFQRNGFSHLSKKKAPAWSGGYFSMVGTTGFEPVTSWSRTRRTTKLCYVPMLTQIARAIV